MTVDVAAWRDSLPAKRMGAGVLICDDQGRVLLVEPTYKDYWEIPGGAVEADESPRSAAAREVEEELGLRIEVGRLLCLEWQGPEPGRSESLMLVYDGGVLDDTSAIRLPADELASYAFLDPVELEGVTLPRLVRRVRAALDALARGAVVELEDGVDVGRG
jgi:8-oxo-dGTP pyrophosphatase MutT (NUDIX family)